MTDENNNRHIRIKLDSLKPNYRDKVVNIGDEGGGDGNIAWHMKSIGGFIT